MFGNKFASEELAKNFQNRVSKLQELKKKASKQNAASKAPSETAQVRPEDFLVAPAEEVDVHGTDLENKINEVSSYAEDKEMESCANCGEHMAADHACDNLGTAKPSMAEDMSYLVDLQAKEVLFELGKVAGELRLKKQSFAADMVEATAQNIQKEVISKAAKKLEVVTGLKKMASESYAEGDRLTGDVISVTIENVKKS